MRVYVATSWKNAHQPDVVTFLRGAGHEVYDFRHPASGNDGFHWTAVDGGYRTWDAHAYIKALQHPIAQAGFGLDMNALRWCDACVLVLPCGRSAHLEAGRAAGGGKRLVIYLPDYDTPELMYGMADAIVTTLADVQIALVAPRTERPSESDPIAAVAADVAQFIKDRIALCAHGAISITCGPCMAPWLPR